MHVHARTPYTPTHTHTHTQTHRRTKALERETQSLSYSSTPDTHTYCVPGPRPKYFIQDDPYTHIRRRRCSWTATKTNTNLPHLRLASRLLSATSTVLAIQPTSPRRRAFQAARATPPARQCYLATRIPADGRSEISIRYISNYHLARRQICDIVVSRHTRHEHPHSQLHDVQPLLVY